MVAEAKAKLKITKVSIYVLFMLMQKYAVKSMQSVSQNWSITIRTHNHFRP